MRNTFWDLFKIGYFVYRNMNCIKTIRNIRLNMVDADDVIADGMVTM